MKLIIEGSHNQAFFEMLRTDPSRLAEPLRAHLAWLEQKKAEGKYLGGYYLPGDGRNFNLWELESEAEYDRLLMEDPLGWSFTTRAHPAVYLLDHIHNALEMGL